jgi:hypothetical protein
MAPKNKFLAHVPALFGSNDTSCDAESQDAFGQAQAEIKIYNLNAQTCKNRKSNCDENDRGYSSPEMSTSTLRRAVRTMGRAIVVLAVM